MSSQTKWRLRKELRVVAVNFFKTKESQDYWKDVFFPPKLTPFIESV